MPSQRERSCVTNGCNDQQSKGSAVGVYINGDDSCTHKLRRPRAMRSASLIVQLTENEVEHRDGSLDFPIKLSAMQKSNLTGMPAILGILADGTIVAWSAGSFTERKKLVIENGLFTLKDDTLTDLFSESLCEAQCDQVDGALGYKTIVDNCPGREPRIAYQICRIPTCCCGDDELTVCTTCAELEAFNIV